MITYFCFEGNKASGQQGNKNCIITLYFIVFNNSYLKVNKV